MAATGADRAAERLAAKLKASAAFYAHLPARPDSRQVRRARARAPIYYIARDGSRRIERAA